MTTKNTIDGDENTFVGGNFIVNLSAPMTPIKADGFKEYFAGADKNFKSEISPTGKILWMTREIDYSAEALFSSLMHLGLPTDIAARIPYEIIGALKETIFDRASTDLVTTADIRSAVVQILECLTLDDGVKEETKSMWTAAYIRRYGSPVNQFIKVLNHGMEQDMDYAFITSVLLPHLLCRILGLPRGSTPEQDFGSVFSCSTMSSMATAIMAMTNTLNLYQINYKTLLFLVQDVILEPPHPWLVNINTQTRVVNYNFERMRFHYTYITENKTNSIGGRHIHAYQEFFRHAGATILAIYGAFLGVGSRYGLSELQRILTMRTSNPILWSYCRIQSIDLDLRELGTTGDNLLKETKGVIGKLGCPAPCGEHLRKLDPTVTYFSNLVSSLHGNFHRLGSPPQAQYQNSTAERRLGATQILQTVEQ